MPKPYYHIYFNKQSINFKQKLMLILDTTFTDGNGTHSALCIPTINCCWLLYQIQPR